MFETIFTPTGDSILSRYTHNAAGGRKPAHWLPVLMLVWTIWIFFVPLFQTGDAFRYWLWPTLASFVVFLGLYWRVYYRSRAQVIWSAWAMAARFKRRISSSLFPENIGPQMASIQPVFWMTIFNVYLLPEANMPDRHFRTTFSYQEWGDT